MKGELEVRYYTFRRKGKTVTVTLTGKLHGSSETWDHYPQILKKVIELAQTGKYDKIYMQCSWTQATGGKFKSQEMPDIIAMTHDGKIGAVFEVRSKRDPALPRVQAKIDAVITAIKKNRRLAADLLSDDVRSNPAEYVQAFEPPSLKTGVYVEPTEGLDAFNQWWQPGAHNPPRTNSAQPSPKKTTGSPDEE